jgi:hypothetical protein
VEHVLAFLRRLDIVSGSGQRFTISRVKDDILIAPSSDSGSSSERLAAEVASEDVADVFERLAAMVA